jgi:hypothetical protein
MNEPRDTAASLSRSLTGDLKRHLGTEEVAHAKELMRIIEAAPAKSEISDGAYSYVIWLVLGLFAAAAGVAGYIMQHEKFWLFFMGGGFLLLFFGFSRYQSCQTPFATLTRTHLRVRNMKTEVPLTAIERYEITVSDVSVAFPVKLFVYFNIFLKENTAEPEVTRSFNTFKAAARWFRKRRSLEIVCGGVSVKGVRGGVDGFCELMERHIEAAHAAEELARYA